MEQLCVSVEQLASTASMIRMQNQKLQQCLKDISSVMNHVSVYWQSPAAETLKQRYHSLLPVFEQYETIVDSYAQFLNQTEQSYASMEQQLQMIAQDM